MPQILLMNFYRKRENKSCDEFFFVGEKIFLNFCLNCIKAKKNPEAQNMLSFLDKCHHLSVFIYETVGQCSAWETLLIIISFVSIVSSLRMNVESEGEIIDSIKKRESMKMCVNVCAEGATKSLAARREKSCGKWQHMRIYECCL